MTNNYVSGETVATTSNPPTLAWPVNTRKRHHSKKPPRRFQKRFKDRFAFTCLGTGCIEIFAELDDCKTHMLAGCCRQLPSHVRHRCINKAKEHKLAAPVVVPGEHERHFACLSDDCTLLFGTWTQCLRHMQEACRPELHGKPRMAKSISKAEQQKSAANGEPLPPASKPLASKLGTTPTEDELIEIGREVFANKGNPKKCKVRYYMLTNKICQVYGSKKGCFFEKDRKKFKSRFQSLGLGSFREFCSRIELMMPGHAELGVSSQAGSGMRACCKCNILCEKTARFCHDCGWKFKEESPKGDTEDGYSSGNDSDGYNDADDVHENDSINSEAECNTYAVGNNSQLKQYGNQPVAHGNQPWAYGNQSGAYGNHSEQHRNQSGGYRNQLGQYVNQIANHASQSGHYGSQPGNGSQHGYYGSQPGYFDGSQPRHYDGSHLDIMDYD